MTWTLRKLVYQAKSPIHVGAHTLGYIKLARPYIPGSAMWGAAAASLTRASGDSNQAPQAYQRFGELLRKDIIFSYFYPALLDPAHPLMPHYTDKGLMFGHQTEADFQSIFIGSMTQTAVMPDSNTAEDESLHESEYIRHKIRDINGTVKEVYFVGYLLMRDDLSIAQINGPKRIDWQHADIAVEPAVRELFIGGDTKYGWGRLALRPDLSEVTDTFFGHRLIAPSDEHSLPRFKVEKESPLPAHLCTSEEVNIKGDIEPLVGRQWHDGGGAQIHEGAGQKITGEKSLYWMPGSVLNQEETLTFLPYGRLAKTAKA